MSKSYFNIPSLLLFIGLLCMIQACESGEGEEIPVDGDAEESSDGDQVEDNPDGDVTEDDPDGDDADGDVDGDSDDYIPPQAEGSIEAGEGIHLDQQELSFGSTLAELKSSFGEKLFTRDLGAGMHRFRIADAPVSGLLKGSGEEAVLSSITLVPGFNGKTAEGIGIGSSRSELASAYGEGQDDPFLAAAWYDTSGLVFEWNNDNVIRIHLKDPALR